MYEPPSFLLASKNSAQSIVIGGGFIVSTRRSARRSRSDRETVPRVSAATVDYDLGRLSVHRFTADGFIFGESYLVTPNDPDLPTLGLWPDMVDASPDLIARAQLLAESLSRWG